MVAIRPSRVRGIQWDVGRSVGGGSLMGGEHAAAIAGALPRC
jgi:hypothetical protein